MSGREYESKSKKHNDTQSELPAIKKAGKDNRAARIYGRRRKRKRADEAIDVAPSPGRGATRARSQQVGSLELPLEDSRLPESGNRDGSAVGTLGLSIYGAEVSKRPPKRDRLGSLKLALEGSPAQRDASQEESQDSAAPGSLKLELE